MKKIIKVIGLGFLSFSLITSCTRRNLEYLVLDDFLKSDVEGSLLGSIKIIDEIRGVDLGYLLFVSGNENKEDHYFYFDKTFLVSKFEGPYQFNCYPYKNKIDDICSFIVHELDVEAGFSLIDKLVFEIEDIYLYENKKSSGYLIYNNIYKINENNNVLSISIED